MLADALCGTFVAAGDFFPLVGGSVPIVTESIEHNIFSLSFSPICIELCGISSFAVHKAGSGGDFRIGNGCFIGFHMACVVLADALCGAFIAALNLFPFVGRSVPIVAESIEHNIFSLSFRPICIELSGVSSFAVYKAGSGGDFRIGDGSLNGFHMVCVVLADALSGTFVAAGNFFPVVGGSVPVVAESVEHNIFSLSFCPSCAEFSGVFALAVHKAGSGGDFRIGDGSFIGFNMACVVLADALCGALVAAGNLFPVVGGSVPVVTESVEHNIFSLSFCPSCAEFSGVFALAVCKAGSGGDFRIGDGRFDCFYMACVVLADALCGTFVAAVRRRPIVGGSVPVVVERIGVDGFFLFGECRVFEFDRELNLSFFGAGGSFYNGHCGFCSFGGGNNAVSGCGCGAFGVIVVPYIGCGDRGNMSSANGANSRVGSGGNMVAVVGGTIHIVECDYIVFFKNVLVKARIGGGVKHRGGSVHLEHPAGPWTVVFVAGIKCYAVFVGNSGHIAFAAGNGVAVCLKNGEYCVRRSLVFVVHTGIGLGKIGEGGFKGAAGNIYGYAYFLGGGVRAFFALYGHYREYGLLVELCKLCIVRIILEFFIIFRILGIGKNAVYLYLGIIFGFGYKEIFALHNGGHA